MDGNVIFDNSNAGNDASGQNPNPASDQSAQPPNQDSAPTAAPPTEGNTGETVTIDNSQAPDTQTADVPPTDTPPPISGGSLWKKIIIGIIALIVIIFLIFLFIPKGESNKKVKLTWWGLWEDQRVMQPLIADFQKENPNITVEYIKQDPKQYREKLTTRIKNGTGPDIFRFHNTWVPMLSDSLLPLPTDVITPNEFKKTYYPVMMKDLTLNNGIYGIPVGADTLGLFVNTELLESAGVEPPTNWDDFVKAAKTLTVKDEGKIKTAGAALGTYGNITHAPDIISLLFIQEGIDMRKFTSSDIKNKEGALNFYTSFAKDENSVWDKTLDESILSFANGSLAMYIGFSWDIFRIQTINKELPFKTYPVPQLVGRKTSLTSYWAEGVSAKSKNQKEAFLFMQHLSKKETAQKFYTEAAKTRSFGEPHARRDLADSLKKNELVYPFVSQFDYASSSFFASDTSDGQGGINTLSNTYLGDAVNSIIDDNNSVQSAVETLDQGVDQVYQKYGVK